MGRGLLRLCAMRCSLGLGAGQAEAAVDLLAVDHRLYELVIHDDTCTEAIS